MQCRSSMIIIEVVFMGSVDLIVRFFMSRIRRGGVTSPSNKVVLSVKLACPGEDMKTICDFSFSLPKKHFFVLQNVEIVYNNNNVAFFYKLDTLTLLIKIQISFFLR